LFSIGQQLVAGDVELLGHGVDRRTADHLVICVVASVADALRGPLP
jgi:hypothetical protein